jgi:hypothetical protein
MIPFQNSSSLNESVCFKIFFNRKAVDRSPELWEKAISKLANISILMEQMNKILGQLA